MLFQVIENTSGLHGDLKGLIGASLQDITMLELPAKANTEDEVEISENDELPF